ncbi:hypothetical protein [Chthonobacter albigriseus]|uniref:hypothetical protein n=1 Tax=Chthonobacter albigriseus TaxID=1683161 RepID=UPI0015EF2DC4|nr:hypothetical protein [Chthonobacter albigriseus]
MGLSVIVADQEDIEALDFVEDVSQMFVLEAPFGEDERIVEVQNWLRANVPPFAYQYQVFSDWEDGEYATTMICMFLAGNTQHSAAFAAAWLTPQKRLN